MKRKKKTYTIQENAKKLADKKNEVVGVETNRWAANLRGKKYTYMYMYKEEKKLKKSRRTSKKEKIKADNDSKCDTYII